MARMSDDEIQTGLRALYDSVTREPIPPLMADLLDQLGKVEPGAMGGNAPGSAPIAGGELAKS